MPSIRIPTIEEQTMFRLVCFHLKKLAKGHMNDVAISLIVASFIYDDKNAIFSTIGLSSEEVARMIWNGIKDEKLNL